MKKKVFWLRPVLFFAALLLIIASCATEDVTRAPDLEQQNGIKSSIVSLERLKTMPGVVEKIADVKHASKKYGRLINDTINNFIINTDNVLLIENGNYQSLTFPITRDEPSGTVENLFLHP